MQKEKLSISKFNATGGGYGTLLLCFAAVLLVAALAVARYPKSEVNFRNADASWHVLLTVEAYNETPASVHLFLPILNLPGEQNKFVAWGDTPQSADGDHYYTSFSPAGFFLPWLFMKIFHLPVSIKSLYIFNTVLFAASAVVWIVLLLQVYDGQKERHWLAALGALTYIMVPEVLHGMGLVYWHQSILQVTLPAQMIAFLKLRRSGSKGAAAAFYLLALANPYIEWTGYVANVGFALAELIAGGKKLFKRSFGRAFLLGSITALSGLLFVLHYLLRIDLQTFLYLMQKRSTIRGRQDGLWSTELVPGYLDSFLYLWLLLFILSVWNIAASRHLELKNRLMLFLIAFPLLENYLMEAHACAYTYDRMKGAWLLSFLVCELSRQLLACSKKRGAVMAAVSALALLLGFANLWDYHHDLSYMWYTSYQKQNEELAQYISENFPDSLLSLQEYPVRGYMNLLFGRSIYEGMSENDFYDLAVEKGCRYAIILKAESWDVTDVDKLTGAEVKDIQAHTVMELSIVDGRILSQTADSSSSG